METRGEQVRFDQKRFNEMCSRSFLNRVRRFESFRERKKDQLNDSNQVIIDRNCPPSCPSFGWNDASNDRIASNEDSGDQGKRVALRPQVTETYGLVGSCAAAR
jgi:hypothetical protein